MQLLVHFVPSHVDEKRSLRSYWVFKAPSLSIKSLKSLDTNKPEISSYIRERTINRGINVRTLVMVMTNVRQDPPGPARTLASWGEKKMELCCCSVSVRRGIFLELSELQDQIRHRDYS